MRQVCCNVGRAVATTWKRASTDVSYEHLQGAEAWLYGWDHSVSKQCVTALFKEVFVELWSYGECATLPLF